MRDIGDCYAYSYIVPKGDVAIVGSVYYPQAPSDRTRSRTRRWTFCETAMPQLGETVKREASVALYVRDRRAMSYPAVWPRPARRRGRRIHVADIRRGHQLRDELRPAGRHGHRRERPREAGAAYERATAHIASNIRRKLKWLPFMESNWGKYLAGYVPTAHRVARHQGPLGLRAAAARPATRSSVDTSDSASRRSGPGTCCPAPACRRDARHGVVI